MGKLAALCVATLLVVFPPRPAAADDLPGPDVVEQARALYEEGATFYRAGRYAEAEVNFRRVHNLLHMPSVLFDLALAQEKQKKWGDAAANFEVFLRDSNRVANREKIEARVERLRELDRRARRVPGTNLSAPEPAPPEEELQLDSGESAPPAEPPPPPEPTPAPAAPTTPAASTPGAPTTPATPAAVPAAAVTPTTPAAPPAEASKGSSRWWIWAIVGGVAVAAVAVGVGVGVSQGSNGGPTPDWVVRSDSTTGPLIQGEPVLLPTVRF